MCGFDRFFNAAGLAVYLLVVGAIFFGTAFAGEAFVAAFWGGAFAAALGVALSFYMTR